VPAVAKVDASSTTSVMVNDVNPVITASVNARRFCLRVFWRGLEAGPVDAWSTDSSGTGWSIMFCSACLPFPAAVEVYFEITNPCRRVSESMCEGATAS
jgi:hypothetical protein